MGGEIIHNFERHPLAVGRIRTLPPSSQCTVQAVLPWSEGPCILRNEHIPVRACTRCMTRAGMPSLRSDDTVGGSVRMHPGRRVDKEIL